MDYLNNLTDNQSIINVLKKETTPITRSKDNDIKIWFRLPCTGVKGESIVKNCVNKLKRCLKKRCQC